MAKLEVPLHHQINLHHRDHWPIDNASDRIIYFVTLDHDMSPAIWAFADKICLIRQWQNLLKHPYSSPFPFRLMTNIIEA